MSVHAAPAAAPATARCSAPAHSLPVDKAEATEDDGSLTGQFTWIIENFNKLKQPKLYSPVFQSGQYNWCAPPWCWGAACGRKVQLSRWWCGGVVAIGRSLCAPATVCPQLSNAPLCRRILLFPSGNNVTQLSVYLDVADSATLPQGWSRQAHFTLTVHNQKDPSRSVIKGEPGGCPLPCLPLPPPC